MTTTPRERALEDRILHLERELRETKIHVCEECGKVLSNASTSGHSCDRVYVRPSDKAMKGLS